MPVHQCLHHAGFSILFFGQTHGACTQHQDLAKWFLTTCKHRADSFHAYFKSMQGGRAEAGRAAWGAGPKAQLSRLRVWCSTMRSSSDLGLTLVTSSQTQIATLPPCRCQLHLPNWLHAHWLRAGCLGPALPIYLNRANRR